MRHATDTTLRRLEDEPLAVADSAIGHVAGCRRCRARRAEIAADALGAAHLLANPHAVPDVDAAWRRLQGEIGVPRRSPARAGTPQRHTGAARQGHRGRPGRNGMRLPVRTGVAVGALGVVAAGTAAAATLTTVFAPTRVAPVATTRSDVVALSSFIGANGGEVLGGFTTTSGTRAFPFGKVTWSSAGTPRQATSARQAESLSGISMALPLHVPSGVGKLAGFLVQPKVSATVTFDKGSLSGSSVMLQAGPAVVAEYGSLTSVTQGLVGSSSRRAGGPATPGGGQKQAGVAGSGMPTMAVVAMPRPTAYSTGATMKQIESFVLSQPQFPAALGEEIRMLGDIRTVLPVPAPAGTEVESVKVGGQPGVLVSASSHALSGVIWEDSSGTIHAVAGLIDQQDALNVAGQLG